MTTQRTAPFLFLAPVLLLWPYIAGADQEATYQTVDASAMGQTDIQALVIPLDNTGIADRAFANPRNPPPLIAPGKTPPTALRFENQTSDRVIQVKLSLCRSTGCAELPEVSASPLAWADFDLGQIDTTSPAVITITVKFFDPTDTPANQFGFISIGGLKPTARPGNPTVVSVVGSITSARDPIIPTEKVAPDPTHPDVTINKQVIRLDKPYDGDQKSHYIGAGKVDLFYALGLQADGKVTLGFKDGDLGSSDSDDGNKLTTKQYVFNIYALNNISLRFGKTVFAQPSNSIAVREVGEGFQLSANRFSLTHIIHRESADGTATVDNEDNRVWIGQMTNAPFPEGHILRRYSLLALYGQDDKHSKERIYDTYGGEIFFGHAAANIGGSLAGYMSHDRLKDPTTPDREGEVALLTLTKFLTGRPRDVTKQGQEVTRSFTALAGFGSGDDPTTPKKESYIGETAGYAKDSIFLSTFGKPLEAGGTANVFRGLANKNYFGFQYNENRWNPLEWFATTIIKIDQTDIIARGITLSLHDYQFREPVLGSTDAGWEADLEIFVQTPKNVKVKLGGAYFSPGKALKDLILKDSWVATASVSIEP